MGENLIFPRTRHLNASYEKQDKTIDPSSIITDKNFTLPSLFSIKNALYRAKEDACLMVSWLGMTVDNDAAYDIQYQNLKVDSSTFQNIEDQNDSDSDSEDFQETDTSNDGEYLASHEILQDLTTLENITGALELQDYSDTNIHIRLDTSFTIVKDSSGKEHIVRKSSIC